MSDNEELFLALIKNKLGLSEPSNFHSVVPYTEKCHDRNGTFRVGFLAKDRLTTPFSVTIPDELEEMSENDIDELVAQY